MLSSGVNVSYFDEELFTPDDSHYSVLFIQFLFVFVFALDEVV